MKDLKLFLLKIFYPSYFKGYKKEYTIEQAEQEYMVLDERLRKEPIPFGFINDKWEKMKLEIKEGDKLYKDRTSQYANSKSGGMERFILIRNGEKKFTIVTKTYGLTCEMNYTTRILTVIE